MQAKKRNNPFRYLPMDIGRLVCSVLMVLYRPRRIHVSGKKYTAKLKGGNIVVSNHTGFSDPFLVGTALWYRRVFFLTAKEVMKSPLIECLLKGIGCIKIDRQQSDMAAIRKCVDLLKEGKVLTIFPQGGITAQGEMDQIKSGAVLIATQANVPIVPMYTVKRKHWWQRQTTVIGDPLDCRALINKKIPSMADIRHLSGLVLEKMEECKKVYEQTV